MTQALAALAGLGAVGFLIWMAMLNARKRGAAEVIAEAESEARKAEQEFTEIVMTPREPGETEKRLEDGTF